MGRLRARTDEKLTVETQPLFDHPGPLLWPLRSSRDFVLKLAAIGVISASAATAIKSTELLAEINHDDHADGNQSLSAKDAQKRRKVALCLPWPLAGVPGLCRKSSLRAPIPGERQVDASSSDLCPPYLSVQAT